MEVQKLLIAAKAFVLRDGKVLIVRESAEYGKRTGTNVGKFDVVGGQLKPGERFDESLRREVREETSLEVSIGKPFFVNEWRPVVKWEQWQIVGIFFECEAPQGEIRLSEDHDVFEWIEPREYKNYHLIENLHPAFEAYLALENVARCEEG